MSSSAESSTWNLAPTSSTVSLHSASACQLDSYRDLLNLITLFVSFLIFDEPPTTSVARRVSSCLPACLLLLLSGPCAAVHSRPTFYIHITSSSYLQLPSHSLLITHRILLLFLFKHYLTRHGGTQCDLGSGHSRQPSTSHRRTPTEYTQSANLPTRPPELLVVDYKTQEQDAYSLWTTWIVTADPLHP